MAAANVVHQFEERKIVADEPDQVRQENQERAKGAEPEPFAREESALGGEKQGAGDREREERGAVFVFHPDSDQDAEPEPITRVVAVDSADDTPSAAEPDERLEGVHGQPMMHQQENRDGERS